MYLSQSYAAGSGKYAAFAAAYNKAVAAGLAAGKAAVPVPMNVYEADGLSGEPRPGGMSWYVSEGVCGFGWVNVSPGNSSFAKWLVKSKLASKAYEGGVDIWVSDFGQSLERKEKCVYAMAEVLRNELGVKAYGRSRID